MAAIDYLKEHGFIAKVTGDQLIVSPASKLTADVRQFIKLHRLELMAEAAANDATEMKPKPDGSNQRPPLVDCPQSVEDPKEIAENFPASNPPLTEHAYQPQHVINTAATASPEWIAARDQYIGHLMACRACHAPVSRYCDRGTELRQQYTDTPMRQHDQHKPIGKLAIFSERASETHNR